MAALTRSYSFAANMSASDLGNKSLASTHFITAPFKPSKVSALRHSSTQHASPIVRSQQSLETAVEESTTTTTASTLNPSATWTSFSEAASGEWDGVNVTFDRDGEAQQLPEYYVPEAYRDWGVQLYDWQSQCSMLANDTGLGYTLRRMMPTVGCEADAIAFTEDQLAVFTPSTAAITPEGGYTWATVDDISPKDIFKASYEHCFPLTTGQRIRIVHNLKRMGSDSIWKVLSVEIHRERRDGPHTGRRELAGCGGGMDPISQIPALEVAIELSGEWRASGMRFVPGNGGSMEASEIESTTMVLVGFETLIGLPLGAWSAVRLDGDTGELISGVVLEDGRVKLAKQNIIGGKVESAELLVLTK